MFSTKLNLLYLLYSTAWRFCPLHLIKQNCFLKTFLWTLILTTQVICLPIFPSRNNLKLHNISVTPKMVKKVIYQSWSIKSLWSWVYSSDGSKELWAWPFRHTTSLMLNFSICVWKTFVFQIVESCHWWSLYLRMLGKRLVCHPVSLLSVVSKVFEKLANNRLKWWHLIYPSLLTESGMLVFFKNFDLMKLQVWHLVVFPLSSVIDGFVWFCMGSLHKNIQLMLEFLVPTHLLLYINDFLDNVICNIAICADDTGL